MYRGTKMQMKKHTVSITFLSSIVLGTVYANDLAVSSLGCDSADSTGILQKALDSGASRIIVDKAGSPWVTGPLFVRSNTELVFEEGVELVANSRIFMTTSAY